MYPWMITEVLTLLALLVIAISWRSISNSLKLPVRLEWQETSVNGIPVHQGRISRTNILVAEIAQLEDNTFQASILFGFHALADGPTNASLEGAKAAMEFRLLWMIRAALGFHPNKGSLDFFAPVEESKIDIVDNHKKYNYATSK